jgi:hypothetical protein
MGDTTEAAGHMGAHFPGELAGPADPSDERTRQVHNGLIHMPATSGSGPSRPKSAPAYYLGRPAHVWTSAMSPRRTRPAANT